MTKSPRLRRPLRRSPRRPLTWLRVEQLEDRMVPSGTGLPESDSPNAPAGPDDDFWINVDYLEQNRPPFDYDTFIATADHGNDPGRGNHVITPPGTLDFLTNDNTGTTGTSGFTQSETTLVAFGNTIVVGSTDSGSNNVVGTQFTGFARSTDGGNTFNDGGTLPTNPNGDAGDPVMARNDATGRIYFATLQFSG